LLGIERLLTVSETSLYFFDRIFAFVFVVDIWRAVGRCRGDTHRWAVGKSSLAVHNHAVDELEGGCACCRVNMDFGSGRWTFVSFL
jgi:hypothetical protein